MYAPQSSQPTADTFLNSSSYELVVEPARRLTERIEVMTKSIQEEQRSGYIYTYLSSTYAISYALPSLVQLVWWRFRTS